MHKEIHRHDEQKAMELLMNSPDVRLVVSDDEGVVEIYEYSEVAIVKRDYSKRSDPLRAINRVDYNVIGGIHALMKFERYLEALINTSKF